MKVGQAIRYKRIQNDLTLNDLASRAGISIAYLSLLERDKRNPNISTVDGISKALNMPLFLLFAPFEIMEDRELVEKLAYEFHKTLC